MVTVKEKLDRLINLLKNKKQIDYLDCILVSEYSFKLLHHELQGQITIKHDEADGKTFFIYKKLIKVKRYDFIKGEYMMPFMSLEKCN